MSERLPTIGYRDYWNASGGVVWRSMRASVDELSRRRCEDDVPVGRASCGGARGQYETAVPQNPDLPWPYYNRPSHEVFLRAEKDCVIAVKPRQVKERMRVGCAMTCDRHSVVIAVIHLRSVCEVVCERDVEPEPRDVKPQGPGRRGGAGNCQPHQKR
jgi:hypothetical protein